MIDQRLLQKLLGVGFSYFHYGSVVSQRHGDALLVLESDTPNSLALSNEFSDKVTRLQIPYFDTAIAATTDNTSVVKLQARNTVVMRSQSVNGREFG